MRVLQRGRKVKWNGESTCAGAMASMRSSAFDPALRLACLGRLGAEAFDEAVHMRDLALLFLVGRLLVGQLFGAHRARTL